MQASRASDRPVRGRSGAALAVAADPAARVAVFRGMGGKAFGSGTDISGFANFSGGADGVAYEQEIDDGMRALDAIPVTTIAVVDGWAVGGGLDLAAACDFRTATPDVSPWVAQPTDISHLACKIVGSTRAMPKGENTMSETGIRPVPWHAIDGHNQDGSVFA